MSRPMIFASRWMKTYLSWSKSRIGQLRKDLIKETTAVANMDSNSLDLNRVKIPHAKKVGLMARVKPQTLNKSFTTTFPIGPKADTVHVSVKSTIRVTFSRKGRLGTDPKAAGSVRKRKPRRPVAVISELTARRDSTVRALYDRLNRYRFVLVRGTPGSGKSTLAQLLADHIRNEEPAVDPIMIDRWVRSKDHWSSRLPDMYNEGPNTFIIDEAQITYWDTELWNSLLKPIIAGTSPNRAVLFASYGDPVDRVIPEATPVHVPDRNRVGLQPVDHGDQITPAGLFYTHMEFADVVEKKYPSGRFEQDFLDYLFHVTAGHPGAVDDLLRIVTADNSYHKLKYNNRYSLEIFRTKFPIEKLWSFFEGSSIFKRGLPRREELQELSTARIFRSVLTNNSVTKAMLDSTEDKNALDQCLKYGWLRATAVQDETVYTFTTPLHRSFVEYYLGDRVAKFTPIAGQDLLTFAIEVIKKFSYPLLSSRAQIDALNNQRTPDAQYHMEFYRCCHEYTNGSLVDFGNASGKIDYYIPGGKWGVSLLRDGEMLENYSSRFVSKGAYAGMEFNDYIILDFCTTQPQKGHPEIPNLYHVVFVNDYKSIRILKGSSLELVTEFKLFNAW